MGKAVFYPDADFNICRAALSGRNCFGVLTMMRPLWQLLLEDPSDLTCDECFAIIEFYTDLLVQAGLDLFPKVLEHLGRCPNCEAQYGETLRRLMQADQR